VTLSEPSILNMIGVGVSIVITSVKVVEISGGHFASGLGCCFAGGDRRRWHLFPSKPQSLA
jgi:hypothetical protein